MLVCLETGKAKIQVITHLMHNETSCAFQLVNAFVLATRSFLILKRCLELMPI